MLSQETGYHENSDRILAVASRSADAVWSTRKLLRVERHLLLTLRRLVRCPVSTAKSLCGNS